MGRFTIFSIILVISLITIFADLSFREYFGGGMASVIEPDPPEAAAGKDAAKNPLTDERLLEDRPEPAQPSAPAGGTAVVIAPPVTPPLPAIAASVMRQAGFAGGFSEEPFLGKVYQLLDITKHPVDAIGHFQIADDDGAPIATVTEIILRDEIKSLQLYTLLQNKTKPYIDLSLNETNAYGDRSFYINHAKKPSEAFLTVKIRNRLYAVAYVKSYHPQVKEMLRILNF